MNSFYLAKKKLKIAGNLDLICIVTWSILIFIISMYHFLYLLPQDSSGNRYSGLGTNNTSNNVTNNFVSTFISTRGYSSFFDVTLVDFLLLKITLWLIVLLLFLTVVLSLIAKIVLGSIALYVFIKAKSIQHIYAAVAVILCPLAGGMIALNTYRATVSPLSPKYIAAYSLLRYKLRGMWNDFINSPLERNEEDSSTKFA